MHDDLFSNLFPESELPLADQEEGYVSEPSFDQRKIWSISSLLSSVQDRLEIHFDLIWVKGEISNLRSPSSGHLYFTLKDNSGQIRAVMFKTQAKRLPFVLEDGQDVICLGNLNIYQNRGDLQLVVNTVEPAGKGALQIAFEQLKEKVSKEGLFDPAHKKELPPFPNRIFLITSPTGAALHDFIKTAKSRNSSVEIVLCPVKVQGDDAAYEIEQALTLAEQEAGPNDLIVIARGGGSLEDLQPFNNEALARAIFNCSVPIVSAIGHEIDFTIADFVADARAATPTAAAQLTVPDLSSSKEQLAQLEWGLISSIQHHIHNKKQKVKYLKACLKEPRWLITERKLLVDDLLNTITQHIAKKRIALLNRLAPLEIKLTASDPINKFVKINHTLNSLSKMLTEHVNRLLQIKKSDLSLLTGQLNSLSPLNVLSRGYGLVCLKKDKKLVTSLRDVKVGDNVDIQLAEGILECEVKSIKKDKIYE